MGRIIDKQGLDIGRQMDRTNYPNRRAMKAPKALKFLFLTTVLYSCYEYPIYKTHSKGKIRNNEYYTLDSVSLVLFEIQA
ncbi:MAG: hypothetical protein WBG42_16425, partial [Cryomorphaceae bacterium]